MALTKPQLYVSRSRMLRLSTAVFIMLSVSLWEGVDSRRCYWCGPLAEQVHRSRRAPPCDADAPAPLDRLATTATTACEPGLPHCAVVATTPPYIESRLCVKIYQDECYSLFCNSTKTWKMTCPCQGDLCNGYTTERENEAFAYLNKLVKKSSRIKRDGIAPSTFSHPEEEKQTNDDDNSVVIERSTNEALPTIENDIENDEVLTERSDQQPYGTIQATADKTNDVEMEIPDSQIGLNDAVTPIAAQSHIHDKEDSVNNILDMNMQADAPVEDVNENVVQSTTLPNPLTDNMGTENDVINAREMFKNVVATEATKLKAIIDQSTELSVKPSGESPTAEALSQNESPTEKSDDLQQKLDPSVTTHKTSQEKVGLTGKTSVATTLEPYTSPTVDAIEFTTKPSKSYAVKIYIHFYNYISWITLYFFI